MGVTTGSPQAPPPGIDDTPDKRVLDPVERTSEILFGVIMALTFTSAIGATSARDEIRTLLVGALTCNIAWGVVDGVMYLMACLAERGAAWKTARAFRDAADPAEARRVLAEALPPTIAAGLDPDALEAVRGSVARSPVMPKPPRLDGHDWKGALAVFLLVTLSTFPLVVPFLLFDDAQRALRTSNGIALAMLWLMGLAYGKAVGFKPWLTAVVMVALGVVLVAITIALEG
jgi:hypothetical protein